MPDFDADAGTWNQLADAAASGDLMLEAGAAARCAQRCSDLIEQLEALQGKALRLNKVEGLGTLPSGIALAEKFGRKASGGDYPLDRALVDHIVVIDRMRDVFLAIESRYAAAEESNTSAATAVESQIN
ncbi:hypothetical protein C8K36_110120 [Rhodococcus sp. OK519]|uniref:hypothetical protein n=1 Tax=Rhodococcus sp. OK519 TaxID=2135729 RepID=UPI000D3DA814|nr:hypothetical protein C8K36_110120 [Rhodococcus sp. OK519]